MAKKKVDENEVSPILGVASEIHVFETQMSKYRAGHEINICTRCGFDTAQPNDTTTIACKVVEAPQS